MAFIETPNAVKVYMRIQFGTTGKPFGQTLWFTKASFTEAEMLLLAGAVIDWYETEIMPSLANGFLTKDCNVLDMTSETGPSVTADANSVAGGVASAAGPASVCLCVTFNTTARGKTAQGRNYISGFAQIDMDGNAIDSIRATAIDAAYALMTTYVGPLGWEHVVVSFQENNTPRAQGLARVVNEYSVRSAVVTSQDRRVNRE